MRLAGPRVLDDVLLDGIGDDEARRTHECDAT